MTNQQYMDMQIAIVQIGKQSLMLPVDAFISSIDHAETVAPMIDPTLYRRGAANMKAIKKLAEAVQQVQIAARELVPVILETYLRENPLCMNGHPLSSWETVCLKCAVKNE